MSAISKFMQGFILGGFVASAAVLLLTPKSGIELQEQLKDTIENIRSEVSKAQDDKYQEMQIELESLKHPQG